MPAWFIYGEGPEGLRRYDYVPNRKFYAYMRIRELTNTRSSFNGGRMIGPGAYEFSTDETRRRGQRWFIFTLRGARHLVDDGEPVDALLEDGPNTPDSPLKAHLRAS